MCSRGKVSLFLVLNFFFLFFISNIRGSESLLDKADEKKDKSASSTTENLSPLTYETYESLMTRFKLKPFHWTKKFKYNMNAEPDIFANLIVRNFCEAHFYGFNIKLRRHHASDCLSLSEQYDRGILYNIMNDRNIMSFLGHLNWFRIIQGIYEQFRPYADYESRPFIQLFESVGVQVCDFLEFILEEMVPRYPFRKGDPDFDMEACCEFEYPIFILAEEVVTASGIALFHNVDILRAFVRRYVHIWPFSTTTKIMKDSLNVLRPSPNYFRQILTLMVRSTPEYFLCSSNMRQYKPLMNQRINFCALMYNMSPIFRALMAIDSEDVQDIYLTYYYKQIRLHYGPCLQIQGDTVKVLSKFIYDSKFSIAKTQEVFNKKKLILIKILKKFFGLSNESYFNLARTSIRNNCLPLYEALLQYLSVEGFSNAHFRELLALIVMENKIVEPLTAISITMGYVDFQDFHLILQHLEKTSRTIRSRGGNPNDILKRLRWISEIYEFIDACPIKNFKEIVVEDDFEPVPWPCPEVVLNFPDEIDDNMKLFFYAQVILAKRFLIPYYNISYFETYLHESVTWSETIHYINFMIEIMANRVGLDGYKLFRFIDTTEYDKYKMVK